ncbi:uncharacterized protein ACRADG_005170 isoform 2-T2 [Cochliomyia hominivorax]
MKRYPFDKAKTAKVKEYGCPKGSVMFEHKCRKILCPLGEYYNGNCLQPECPSGLVWRGKVCQKPLFVTTVLKIDNVFVNQINETPIALETSHINKVVYYTSTTTTQKPHTISTTTYHLVQQNITSCCQVVSPRICKFRICSYPIVYLKAPEIKYDHPTLVMPPNPILEECGINNCYNNLNVVNCSGCVSVRSENCSPHCYRYMCPKKSCTFMDLSVYCTYYSGQNGCLPIDGCLWNWC